MTQKDILVFCRNYLVADFRLNLEPLRDEYSFVFASDGPGDVDMDTRERFYRYLKQPSDRVLFDTAEIEDIRLRCRLLRNLDAAEARRRIVAMGQSVQDLLDRVDPAMVLCHMVDEYVIDVLSVLTRRRGLQFLSYCASFFPDLVQLTEFSHGRPFDVRHPDEAEVARVRDVLMQDQFRQSYIQAPSLRFRDHLRGFLRYQVKRVVFPIKARLERDPLAVHYEILPYVAEHRRLRDFPSAALFERDWRSALAGGKAAGRTLLYVPLSYSPESTNDYWVPNIKAIHYEKMILEVIAEAAKKHLVVVKEHIHMIGCRSRSFYETLKGMENVVNVHPTEFSNLVLAECDILLLGGGSSGVEATLRGRPVLSYCESSYWFEASQAEFLDLDDLGALDTITDRMMAQHEPLSETEKQAFLAKCLASTVRRKGFGRRWPIVEPDDMRLALNKALAR